MTALRNPLRGVIVQLDDCPVPPILFHLMLPRNFAEKLLAHGGCRLLRMDLDIDDDSVVRTKVGHEAEHFEKRSRSITTFNLEVVIVILKGQSADMPSWTRGR
jgi:hypothetical protein